MIYLCFHAINLNICVKLCSRPCLNSIWLWSLSNGRQWGNWFYLCNESKGSCFVIFMMRIGCYKWCFIIYPLPINKYIKQVVLQKHFIELKATKRVYQKWNPLKKHSSISRRDRDRNKKEFCNDWYFYDGCMDYILRYYDHRSRC